MKVTNLLVVLAVLAPSGALAHHSFATYDMTRTVSVEGTARKLEWMNPHLWLWVDLPKEDGSIEPWGFEGGPISLYARAGWRPDTVKRGDKLKVEFHPLKSGEHAGSLTGLWVNGTEIPMRRPPSPEGAAQSPASGAKPEAGAP